MKKRGYALATILVLLGVAMFGVGALISVSTLESKISRSQQESVTAYYVAEAGVEDALWKINTNSAYSSALTAGTLNTSYTVNNEPASGEAYTVALKTASQGAGYATLDVVGTSNNGIFTAQRHIITTVFLGPSTNPTNNAAFLTGGNLSFSNTSGTVSITGGNLFANSGISFNQVNLNMNNNSIETPGAYSSNQSSLQNVTGINAASCSPTPAGGCQPPPSSVTPPSFSFSYYQANNNVAYTPAQFQTAIQNGTVNFPGPVTYINGDLNIGSWMKNKTVTFTGMLVINGSLAISPSVNNAVLNVNDPGNGQSGIFVANNINNGAGTWNINGVLYAAGNITSTGSQTLTVNGAVVAGGVVSINPGFGLTVNYNQTRAAGAFSNGAPQALSMQYWEEEY